MRFMKTLCLAEIETATRVNKKMMRYRINSISDKREKTVTKPKVVINQNRIATINELPKN
jgi:hypothetical protein